MEYTKKKLAKRIGITTAILLLLAVIAGGIYLVTCNKGQPSSDKTKFYNAERFFSTDDGYYYINSKEFLNYFDYKSETSAIVCTKLNCKHERWDENTPDAERCDAYCAVLQPVYFENDGSLFLFSADPIEQKTKLIKSKPDRTMQVEVLEFESNHTFPFVIQDGILYSSMVKSMIETDENGLPNPTGESETCLYKIDLKSGTKTNLTDIVKNYNSTLEIFGMYDNKIYCSYNGFENKFDGTNFEAAENFDYLYIFDIETKTWNKTEKDIAEEERYRFRSIYSNQMLYAVTSDAYRAEHENFDIYQKNLDNGQIKKIASANDYMKFVSDHEAIYKTGDNYYSYNIKTEKISQMSPKMETDYSILGDAGKFYCVWDYKLEDYFFVPKDELLE